MTTNLFITILTIGSLVSSLLTEALKKGFKNISTNIIALVNAGIVGLAGTIIAYILMEIPFTPQNIACLVLIIFCVWIGSMVSYDKLMQTLSQIKNVK